MTEIELIKGAAILLAQKLCVDNNTDRGSITIGGVQKKGGKDKPRNYRVTVRELTDDEVEHNQDDKS
jgi:hypothetical protein